MAKKNNKFLLGHGGWYWSRDGIYFEAGRGFVKPQSAMVYVRRSTHHLPEEERPKEVFLIYGVHFRIHLDDIFDEMLDRFMTEKGKGRFFRSDDDLKEFKQALREEADLVELERGVRGSYVKFFEDTKHKEKVDWDTDDYVRLHGGSYEYQGEYFD